MTLEHKTLAILALVIVAAIVLVVIISRHQKPKWQQVYDYLQNMMFELDIDDEYNQVVQIRNYIVVEFDLTVEQADACIENWQKRYWFQKQEWLSGAYEAVH